MRLEILDGLDLSVGGDGAHDRLSFNLVGANSNDPASRGNEGSEHNDGRNDREHDDREPMSLEKSLSASVSVHLSCRPRKVRAAGLSAFEEFPVILQPYRPKLLMLRTRIGYEQCTRSAKQTKALAIHLKIGTPKFRQSSV
jgi:hypothetical protein